MVTLPPYTPMQKKIKLAFPNQGIDPNVKRINPRFTPDTVSDWMKFIIDEWNLGKPKDPRLTKNVCPTCGQTIPNTTDNLKKTTI